MLKQAVASVFVLLASAPVLAQEFSQTVGDHENKFRQMETAWPAPNRVRLASGAPGPDYWQQHVSYEIDARLDESARRLHGQASIVYENNAPERLDYLWFDLDMNRFRQDSFSESVKVSPWTNEINRSDLIRITTLEQAEPGITIGSVKIGGREASWVIRDTHMRIDLPAPLQSGAKVEIEIAWTYDLPDVDKLNARSGYRCEEGARCIFVVAHWYPRPTAYTDTSGWTLEPFFEWAEFNAEFSDFSVALTVPDDVVVAATGALANEREVLSAAARTQLHKARASADAVIITSPSSASDASSRGTKTWRFKAANVRDFAFAASADYIWSAKNVQDAAGRDVTVMAYYTPGVAPLWEDNALNATGATVSAFSAFLGAFPYAHASVAFGPVPGMEHPMLAFIGASGEGPETLNRLVSAIAHEVGHNYAPLSLNSNERLYGWMDEGLTTFLEQFAEQQWNPDYPVDRGRAGDVAGYMTSPWQIPAMARQDDAFANINHAYKKPAAALSVLRDTVLGPEIFGEALKVYYSRWKNKRATPHDLFRTFEDVSGRDLDWFWRGWFFTTEHVDLTITQVIDISLPEDEQNAIDPSLPARKKYLVYIENLGGLPSPALLRVHFADGSFEDRAIPAELWRRWSRARRILHMTDREAVRFELDPDGLTGDAAPENNVFSAPFEHRDGSLR